MSVILRIVIFRYLTDDFTGIGPDGMDLALLCPCGVVLEGV